MATQDLQATLAFIKNATHEDLLSIIEATSDRQDEMFKERAAAAVVGAYVMVEDSDPDYLEGLTGTIIATAEDDLVVVRLDVYSARILRFNKEARKGGYLVGDEPYNLTVSACCCVVTAPLEAAAV